MPGATFKALLSSSASPAGCTGCNREGIRRIVDKEHVDLGLGKTLRPQGRDERSKYSIEGTEYAAAGLSHPVPAGVLRHEHSLQEALIPQVHDPLHVCAHRLRPDFVK